MTVIDSGRTPPEGLLPDPAPRQVHYTVISVDDHLVEPAAMFEGRLPARYADRAPRVVRNDAGNEVWSFDGQVFEQLGLNAVVGHANRDDWTYEPAGFADMRPGCYDIHERIKDMDINGIWASVNFPSQIAGFCGTVFSNCRDRELGIATTRAWNDWFVEEWWSPYPERIVPMAITYLADPDVGAAEIRRNAARGCVAVTLPEQPHRLGLPSLYTDYWDPILQACAETGTVICLHVASSGVSHVSDDAPRPAVTATLFPALSFYACVDWIWSGVLVRHPALKVMLAEGGIGWVPMLIDRLDFMMSQSGHGRKQWMSATESPTDVLRRGFWFCMIDNPSMMPIIHTVGVERILVESDYPHADSTWPDTQRYMQQSLGHLPAETIRKITYENAARLFRHPLPAVCLP